MALISLALFTTTTGLNLLDVTDNFVNQFGILAAGLVSIFVVAYLVRALPTLRDHINARSSWKMGKLWMILLAGVTPIILGYSLVNTFINLINEPYEGYPAEMLNIFGWGMVVVLLVAAVIISLLPWPKTSRASLTPPAPPVSGGKVQHDHVDSAAQKVL